VEAFRAKFGFISIAEAQKFLGEEARTELKLPSARLQHYLSRLVEKNPFMLGMITQMVDLGMIPDDIAEFKDCIEMMMNRSDIQEILAQVVGPYRALEGIGLANGGQKEILYKMTSGETSPAGERLETDDLEAKNNGHMGTSDMSQCSSSLFENNGYHI